MLLPSALLFLFLFFSSSLKDVQTSLKIGVRKEVKPCRRFAEDGNWVYAHIVAYVEGREAPVVDTYKTGNPMHFQLNNSHFIQGFNLGLRGACEGEIRRVTIPSDLAYRGDSVVGLFGPHSSWILDAEIIEVVKEKTI